MPPRYKPVKDQRYFNHLHKYAEIDWNDEAEVANEFKRKLTEWYIKPARALHPIPDCAFAALALTCMLIDTLSQFESGALSSNRNIYMQWLRLHFPVCRRKFSKPILERAGSAAVAASDYAEALYFAFRCGILHESHPAVYSGIFGQNRAFRYYPEGYTTYEDGSPCPTVVIDPWRLLRRVRIVLNDYFDKLQNPDPRHQPLRDNFKRKFLASYGIDIGNEA